MSDERMTSHLRVFLSADLVGSTRLKNRLNHQELYEKFRSRLSVLTKVREADANVKFSDEVARAAVLESLGVSTEDVDWATVVEFFYKSLHSEFSANLAKLRDRRRLEHLNYEPKPWKAVGDELIYQFVVRSRLDLHWIVVAFLAALRSIDRKVTVRGGSDRGLRIKGSAWTAGFPVRNRVILLPAINTEDFLGPDIDTGFRIGKCTKPGMLVGSVELVELVSEAPDVDPVVGKIVGWEELKGVWNDKRYPVVWMDLPSGHPGAAGGLKAQDFDDWEQEECPWCRTWEDSAGTPKTALREFMERLRRIRSSLPKALGLVDPYIVDDRDHEDRTDSVPEDHRRILDLLRIVREHQAGVQKQDTEEAAEGVGSQLEAGIAKLGGLFEQDPPEAPPSA